MTITERLQAMQPTEIGVRGSDVDRHGARLPVGAPRPPHLPRAGAAALRRPGLVPRARFAGAARERPRRRAAGPADRSTPLGQVHGAVRRPRAGDRLGTAGLGRAELDRAPSAGRARVPPRATHRGERPRARRRRRRDARVAAGHRSRRPRRRVPDAPDRARRRREGAVLRGPRRPCRRPAPRQQRGCRDRRPARALDPADGRVGADADQPPAPVGAAAPRHRHRAADGGAARATAGARCRPARRRPPRPAPRQRPHRPRDPRRARHDGDRRPRDRRRLAHLDPHAPRRGPRRAGEGPRRAGRAARDPSRCSTTATASPGPAQSSTRHCGCSRRPG